MTLLQFALVMLIAITPLAGGLARASDDDEIETEAGGHPAQQPAGAGAANQVAAPAPSPAAQTVTTTSSGNNIVGLNVARLRQQRSDHAAAAPRSAQRYCCRRRSW